MSIEFPGTREALDLRVRTLLPEQYRHCYEDVQPVSMGSAGLKYGRDGKVQWDSIWGSFCDLAMAGGPPHKGTLLEPGTPDEIAANPEQYAEAADEICRGVGMATGLAATRSATPGWISVDGETETTADWLVRAINMENVSALSHGSAIHLPAGPAYRIEKEIKNVVTAIAKTAHYWLDHTRPVEQREVGDLLARMAATAPLLQPAVSGGAGNAETQAALRAKINERVARETGLRPSTHPYFGWCGFDCPGVPTAIWMMRALVGCNVLARREDVTLFVPVNPAIDPDGSRIANLLIEIFALAVDRPAGVRQ